MRVYSQGYCAIMGLCLVYLTRRAARNVEAPGTPSQAAAHAGTTVSSDA